MSKTVVLHFSVSDAGAGFRRKTRHDFPGIHQADNSPTRQHGGIGLGLAICRRLVNLMEGTFGWKVRWAEGARFISQRTFGKLLDIIEFHPFG